MDAFVIHSPGGEKVLINTDAIVSIKYTPKTDNIFSKQTLVVKLLNGDELTMGGDDAERMWGRLTTQAK